VLYREPKLLKANARVSIKSGFVGFSALP